MTVNIYEALQRGIILDSISTCGSISDTDNTVKEFLVSGITEENNTVVSLFLGVDCCYNLPPKEFGLSYDSISFLIF